MEKGGLEAWPSRLAGAHTVFLLEREALGTSLYAVFKGTQIIMPIYKELFNKTFEAFILLKKIWSSQLPGNGIQPLSRKQNSDEFGHCSPLVISIT